MSEEKKISWEFFVGRNMLVVSAMPVPVCVEADGKTAVLKQGNSFKAEQAFEATLISVSDGVVALERMIELQDGSVHANLMLLPLSAVSMVEARQQQEARRVQLIGVGNS